MFYFKAKIRYGINRFKLARKMKTYTFRVVVEPDEDRWFAYCPVLEGNGGATWGYTKEEALKNIREVVEMTVESMIEHGEPIPEEPETEVKVSSQLLVAIAV
jgi:predicted RNase H-like HicB family nuclease